MHKAVRDKFVSRKLTAVLFAAVMANAHAAFCFEAAPASRAALSEFHDIRMTPHRNLLKEQTGSLRADAQELADIMEVAPLVERIRAEKQSNANGPHTSRSIQNARLICLWRVFIASEEVRKLVATINFNLSSSHAALDELTTKRNMTSNMVNTMNFTQGGVLGTLKQATAFPGKHQAPLAIKQEIGMTTFSLGIALALTNMVLPSVWRRKIDQKPNILAHFFNPDFRPPDADRSYLWKFLDAPVPGSASTLTRREILIEHWQSLKMLTGTDERLLRRLSQNCESEDLNESIAIITKRMALLHDLRTHIEEFDGALFELHKAISMNERAN